MIQEEFEGMTVQDASLDDLDPVGLAAYVEHRSPGAISVNALELDSLAVGLGLAGKVGRSVFPTVVGLLLFGTHPQLRKPQ